MDSNQINRLGFDAWCSNLAVNLIENQQMIDGYNFECEDYIINVKKVNNKHSVFVRAYINNLGWKTSETVY